jgi:dihydrofolate reductase
MPNIVFIATSIDGYIATVDGGLEWLDNIPNPENSDFGYVEFMNRVDAIVMGRNTFEKVLTFDSEWPYEKPLFVLSRTLKDVPDHLTEKVKIISGMAKEITELLNDQGFKNLYIDGGVVIQNFLKEDQIDEMIITTVPVLLGSGIPLFGHLEEKKNFKLTRTENFSNSVVQNYYSKV